MNRKRRLSLARGIAAAALAVTLAGASAAAGRRPAAPDKAAGLDYSLRILDSPRPNRVHIVRVDFAGGLFDPAVIVAPDPDGSGPAEATLTDPRILADDPRTLAFLNTNPWDALPGADGKRDRRWRRGQPVDIHGLAVSGGVQRSAAEGRVSVWVDGAQRVHIGAPPAGAEIRAGMAGFEQIVTDGKLTAGANAALHPRTALGTDREGQSLWMVVVDGRQPGYSEGMTTAELGGLMLSLGCRDAVNMDGGGSSVLGMREPGGELRIVNTPSGSRLLLPDTPLVRPLPMVLTIRKAE